MRLSDDKAHFIKNELKSLRSDAMVYLFGSRVDADKKGGDIDILVISNEKLSWQEIANVQIAFWKAFGEQKIDIVSYRPIDQAPFKSLALENAILI